MKRNMVIAQLRGTIFAPLSIGYTPETYSTFRDLLLPEAKAYNANPTEMIIPGGNLNDPQYGLPWRLSNGEYNIVFLPGKIDIILSIDANYSSDIEKEFCNKCSTWFSKILSTQGQIRVNRIAYAPLYAIRLDNTLSSEMIWGRMLKNTLVDGTSMQDIKLNFLLKRKIPLNGTDIQMNLLYNFSDGMQIKQIEDRQEVYKVVLLQLDLNSIPESPLALDSMGIKDFFNCILVVKNDLVDHVAE